MKRIAVNVKLRSKAQVVFIVAIIITGIIFLRWRIREQDTVNNNLTYLEIITVRYPSRELNALKNYLDENESYITDIKKEYNLECIRENQVLYDNKQLNLRYAILLDEMEYPFYIFFDEQGAVWHTAYYYYFPEGNPSEKIEKDITTRNEVLEMIPNEYNAGFHGRNISGYILEQGILFIEYTSKEDEYIVANIWYFQEPEELEEAYRYIPQIKDIDKHTMIIQLSHNPDVLHG